jgi:hypothetical protein
MASDQDIRTYLAMWFQLGKSVVCHTTGRSIRPKNIHQIDRYSPEFEKIWHTISQSPHNYYLAGTDQSIQTLQSSAWEINDCARCEMPIPMCVDCTTNGGCTCQDLSFLWPNYEVPSPHLPVNNANALHTLCDRLTSKSVTQDHAILDFPSADSTHPFAANSPQDLTQLRGKGDEVPRGTMRTNLKRNPLDAGDNHEAQPSAFSPDAGWSAGQSAVQGVDSRADVALTDTLSSADYAIALSIQSERQQTEAQRHPQPTDNHPQPHPTPLEQQRQENQYQAQQAQHQQDLAQSQPDRESHPITQNASSPSAPVYPYCQVQRTSGHG